MKKLSLILMFLVACGHAKVNQPRQYRIVFADDLRLDHDQIMICSYDRSTDRIGCMSPDEFKIRYQVNQDK